MRDFRAFVDTALERSLGRSVAELSNAVSSSAQTPHSGEWLAGKHPLSSAGISSGVLTVYVSLSLVSCHLPFSNFLYSLLLAADSLRTILQLLQLLQLHYEQYFSLAAVLLY